MSDLAELAIGKTDFDRRTELYLEKVIPDLTNLYDVFYKLRTLIAGYKEGVANGRYFNVNERGHSSFNRLNEVEIYNLTKDFLIRCKIAIVNFVKSGFTDENDFKLADYFFCNSTKFKDKKQQHSRASGGKYLPLLNLIENANVEFLTQLNDIRGAIEHDLFSLPKFILHRDEPSSPWLEEPLLQDRLLSDKLSFYYEKSLEFIEKMMAYFIGINGERNLNGFLELHVDNEFDFQNMKYKYRFSLGGTPWSLTSRKCFYD
jgi:hypothetical protein